MADVVREILLCLFFASLLGVAIGWLARGLRARRMAADEAIASRHAREELRAQLRITDSARASDQQVLEELQNRAASATSLTETLRRELREAETARDAARHDVSGTRDQMTKLAARLREVETARDAAKEEAEAARAGGAGGRARVADLADPRGTARREGEPSHAGQPSPPVAEDTLRQRFETLRATLQAAENGWDAARAHAEAALEQLGATRRQLVASEVDRNALAALLAESQTQLAEARAKLVAAPTQPSQGEASRPSPQHPKPAPPRGATSNAVRDDLQEIRGIGPVMERTLHRAGVYRYAQIASWTHEDILSMGKRLPGFHDRIVRDRWTAAARRLHIAKYGSPP